MGIFQKVLILSYTLLYPVILIIAGEIVMPLFFNQPGFSNLPGPFEKQRFSLTGVFPLYQIYI